MALAGRALTLCWASGPLATLAGIAVLEALRLPNPGPVLQTLVVYAAASGGLASGLASAALGWLYAAWFLSTPGQFFTYQGENLPRMLVLTVVLPLTALVVGVLSRRSLRLVREQVEAEAAARMRETLLAAASHDLKNPLTSIKGTAQVLRRRATNRTLTPEQLTAGLDAINATASRMAAQIDALRDVIRLDAGRPLGLERHPTDLVALARQAAGVYQQASDVHEVVVITCAPEIVGLWDPVRLERLLANLLGNAIKYSPIGGRVTVALAVEDVPAGSWAVLRVQDHGLGIPAKDLPRIFDRFYRAENVARTIAGAGIGLSAVRQIAEEHGGSVQVESQVGRGSAFVVRLPLLPVTGSQQPREAPAPAPA